MIALAEKNARNCGRKIPIMGQFTPHIKTNKQKDRNTKAHEKIGSTSLYNLKNCIINIDLDPLD